MSETIFGIPLKILFAVIAALVALAFTVFYIFIQKGSSESIISIALGMLYSFVRGAFAG